MQGLAKTTNKLLPACKPLIILHAYVLTRTQVYTFPSGETAKEVTASSSYNTTMLLDF